jgi:hypothetical protein
LASASSRARSRSWGVGREIWTGTAPRKRLEERRGFRELGGQIPSNLPHRGLGEDQTKKAQFPENQDGVASARAGQQPGDQDVSIDADEYRLSLLGPGHPDPSRKAFALDANVPSRPRAVGRRAAED